MYSIIVRFIKFLLPILKTASIQVAADTINDIAYQGSSRKPPRPYRYMSYARPRTYGSRDHSSLGFKPRAVGDNPKPMNREFHDVLLVAFDIFGRDAEDAHKWLMENLPEAGQTHGDVGEIFLDSWWVANDERFDRSDTDSAVFVSKGNQAAARKLLREAGLVD